MGLTKDQYWHQGLEYLQWDIEDFIKGVSWQWHKSEMNFKGCAVKVVLEVLDELGIDSNIKETIGPQLMFNHPFTYNGIKFNLWGNAYMGNYTLRVIQDE